MTPGDIARERRAQERQWRAEEKQEWDAELRAINAHRPDCLCRATRDWSPGPACYQVAAMIEANLESRDEG